MKFKKIVSIGLSEDALDNKYWDKIDQLADERVVLAKESDQIPGALKDADCLLVWFNGANKATIDMAPNLKYIGALATGVGKIDVSYARSKGIMVTNIPGYSTEAVAELTLAILLENLREIARGKNESKQARTSEASFSGHEIKGKDFGVVGLGRIGGRVAELADVFGANVYYYSREKKNVSYNYENLDKLITHCDFLSINLALNNQTENILNANRVKGLKSGTIIINTAPQELVDFDSLVERLSNDEITYICDHTDPDDISDERLDKLRQLDSCITYPVLGYITDEAKIALQEIFVGNLKAALVGKPQNEVS